jgi:Carboxypeptidase regulatory-like domain
MARYLSSRIGVSAFGLALAAATAIGRQTPSPAPVAGLTVSLAVEQPTVVQPFPARMMLTFRNTGSKPLWLYHPIRDTRELARAAARMPEEAGEAANWSSGGSRLVIHLEAGAPGSAQPAWTLPPHGDVLLSEGMPHPRLVSLAPGGEQDEGAAVDLAPGLVMHSGGAEPQWGHYRLSVTYGALYSNGAALSRDLSADIWQGEVESNALDIDLEPAPAAITGSFTGRITDESGNSVLGVLVSLSDANERLTAQALTDGQGRYSFGHLPFGRYFITARRPGATTDTAIFGHADLDAQSPSVAVNLVLLNRETNEAKDILHKPLLLRVVDSAGEPLSQVEVEALWSSGNIAETVKGETDANGGVALNVLPGRSYLTLKHRKCSSQDGRVDVAEGDGIDGSIQEYDCRAR